MGRNELTEWDDDKRDLIFRNRVIDLEALYVCLDGRPRLIREDIRRDYGEPRFNMLTRFDGQVLLVTFTPRDTRLRLISARRANRKERTAYEDYERAIDRHQQG